MTIDRGVDHPLNGRALALAWPIVVRVVPTEATERHILHALLRQEQLERYLLGKGHEACLIVEIRRALLATMERHNEWQARPEIRRLMNVHGEFTGVPAKIGYKVERRSLIRSEEQEPGEQERP